MAAADSSACPAPPRPGSGAARAPQCVSCRSRYHRAMICAVIADDLTGACDSAVQFANVGLRTLVALEGPVDAEVVAWSTESRHKPGKMPGIPAECSIVFKKIDSTLRGNTRADILAALDAYDFDTAI